MLSNSRNSRFAVRVLRLAIAGVVQGGALLAGSVAHAADQPNKFVMTAFTNSAGGENIVNGRYQDAIEQTQRAGTFDTTTASNQCVAYTMSGQFAAAQPACDAAVYSAKQDVRRMSAGELWAKPFLSESLAIAYENRAVLHWLSHDDAAAHSDLSKADEADPKAASVAQNVRALNSPEHENAVAQVLTTTAPRR